MIPGAWAALRGHSVCSAPDAGLINQTYEIGHPPRFVAQRVNPIFGPTVHEDIEAVTAHLARQGLATPRLVRTDDGALWAADADDGVWRVWTYVPGRTVHRVTDAGVAAEAGALVARFHRATDALEWAYRHVRAGAHDTLAHMARLGARIRSGGVPGEDVAVAEQILEAWRRWEGSLDEPPRHAHGDLKISNLRFDGDGRGVCLLDLDTLSLLPIDVELGDALRSWCNPVGEDSLDTWFDLDLFEAAMQGYLSVRRLTDRERSAVAAGPERIALELASRFCLDAIEDRYFGWNSARFPSRVAHNRFRAEGQLRLGLSAHSQRDALRRVLADAGD